MNGISSLWRGDLRLSDAFWNWAVFGALVINISTTILFLWLVSVGQTWPAVIVGYAFSVPYNVIALVGVWRSAARHDGPAIHADLARWISLTLLVFLSMT